MRAILLLSICIPILAAGQVSGTTRYVAPPPLGSNTNPGTEELPFATIQHGIDASGDGDTVTVAQGTYIENIHFDGKNIVLSSTDPLSPTIVASTIIDGNKLGCVVTFSGTETEACVLSGFTVRNGQSSRDGGGIGTDNWQNRFHARIENNIITGNRARGGDGGGIASCDGTIQNNTISGNSTEEFDDWGGWGGGVAWCDGTIQNNTITGNSADAGGGLMWCDGTIQNNIIAGNSANGGLGYGHGGGLSECAGPIQDNMIGGNSAEHWGGGLDSCSGTVENNTITGNWAGESGGGLSGCTGAIRNCIIWENTAPSDPQLASSSIPAYSCIEGWSGGGIGNITSDPLFLNSSGGNYHLQEGSPCIDAGVSGYWFVWPRQDLDGNCRLVGLGADMGCYEYGSSKDADGDLFSDADESAAGTDSLDEDTDDDGLRDGLELLRGSDPLQVTPPGIFNVPSEIPTIQQCLYFSIPGDEIIVAPGTYLENVQLGGVDVILRSSDPDDPGVVGSTILDGGGAGSVVQFRGGESEACVLAGFTIRNGYAPCGGGILGNGTHATVRNNTITANSATGTWQFGQGGGIAYCDGLIQDNTITANSSESYRGALYGCGGLIENNTISSNSGGGLYDCDGAIRNNRITENEGSGLNDCGGTIENNTITGNSAGTGGGLAHCYGMIHNNTIAGNSAVYDGGGGLAYCHGTIQNNTITANSATGEYGCGGGLYICSATIQNNVIADNSAVTVGGGLYLCDGAIRNNTITGNSAVSGGGLYECRGMIQNCIVWANTAPSDPQVANSRMPTYSCIEGWSAGGTGNIASDPLFLDASGQNYRLQDGSPCIDAGANGYWLTWPQRDADGNCRLAGGRVDMGFYEYGSSADADGDLLSDADESAAGTNPLTDDSDGDGLRDGLELLRGSDPLQVTPPGILNVPSDIPTIQLSLCVSITGDEIVVAPGTYYENLQFCGSDVILRGSDPGDSNATGSTIIDGGRAGSVVSFTGRESEACVLEGFTIRNGQALYGGGIFGGTYSECTHATIQNNIITANSATGLDYSHGGGLYECHGAIRNNLITGNSVGGPSGFGGGLFGCGGTIENNTIAGNSALEGGVSGCDGTIRNCIIWGNTDAQFGGSASVPTYSCIEGWSGGGEGNISEGPRFVDPDGPDNDPATQEDNDYRLLVGSPCIDTGKNEDWMWTATDLDGNPRILDGGLSLTVDMGAYERHAFRISQVVGESTGGLQLTWTSIAGVGYGIWSCTDLTSGDWIQEQAVLAEGDSTSWTDPSPGTLEKFYRVEQL